MTPEQVERALATFGVYGTVTRTIEGPMVTTFEIEPIQGTRVSSFMGLERDLDLTLRVTGVQVKLIPNSGLIGLSVPKLVKAPVTLPQVFSTPEYLSEIHPLAVGVGIQEDGKPLIIRIDELPHLLIASQTGGGKSILLHSIICSILHKHTDRVQLVLIDPKGTEFNCYSGIPEMITKNREPIVTDRDAIIMLGSLVRMMESRYADFAREGVRDIDAHNRKFPSDVRPYIVVVIDELADLILQAKKHIEPSIIRLAQKARAAGIHLILATQRPTAQVVTGLIKANIPGRIALRVRSALDSRIILDQGGAEKLLGKGDLLFLGGAEAIRAQGAWVSPEEIAELRDNLIAQESMVELDGHGNAVKTIVTTPLMSAYRGVMTPEQRTKLYAKPPGTWTNAETCCHLIAHGWKYEDLPEEYLTD